MQQLAHGVYMAQGAHMDRSDSRAARLPLRLPPRPRPLRSRATTLPPGSSHATPGHARALPSAAEPQGCVPGPQSTRDSWGSDRPAANCSSAAPAMAATDACGRNSSCRVHGGSMHVVHARRMHARMQRARQVGDRPTHFAGRAPRASPQAPLPSRQRAPQPAPLQGCGMQLVPRTGRCVTAAAASRATAACCPRFANDAPAGANEAPRQVCFPWLWPNVARVSRP